MALITCPECGKEMSDKASACPSCGFPITPSPATASTEPPSTPPETMVPPCEPPSCPDTSKTPSKKKYVFTGIILAVVAIAAILIVLAVNGTFDRVTASNVDIGSLYYSDLGVGVRLGQSKASVDKLLGAPEESYDSFLYNGELYVTYKDGKVFTLYFTYPNDRWVTKGGITVDTTTQELISILGEPRQRKNSGELWYYQDGNKIIGLKIVADKVSSILIYDALGTVLAGQAEVDANGHG